MFQSLKARSLAVAVAVATVAIASPALALDITVKTIDGRTLKVYPDSAMTVFAVKQMIENQINVPADQMVLIYMGRNLDNDQTLAEYRVPEQATIHVVFRPRG